MKGRKTSLLKWAAMIELVIGAYNLMTGVMSAYVLITDLDGVMASFADSGVEYSAAILGVSVAITNPKSLATNLVIVPFPEPAGPSIATIYDIFILPSTN